MSDDQPKTVTISARSAATLVKLASKELARKLRKKTPPKYVRASEWAMELSHAKQVVEAVDRAVVRALEDDA